MSSDPAIQQAFERFVHQCASEVRELLKSSVPLGSLIDRGQQVFENLSEGALELDEAKSLIEALRQGPQAAHGHSDSNEVWRHRLASYLRMKGIWAALLDGAEVDAEELAQDFVTRLSADFGRTKAVAPLVNFTIKDMEGLIHLGPFSLRVITQHNFKELVAQGFDGQWSEDWYDVEKDQISEGRVFIERFSFSGCPLLSIEDRSGQEAEPTDKPSQRKLSLADVLEATNPRLDLRLPYQDHPFFGELLRINLFMPETTYVREAFLEKADSFEKGNSTRDLNPDESGSMEYFESDQTLSNNQLYNLRSWIEQSDDYLDSEFLRKSPYLFFALKGFIEGDMAYRGASGKRLKAYVHGLDALYKPSSDSRYARGKEASGVRLAKRATKMLRTFLQDLKATSNLLVDCYRIRSEIEHPTKALLQRRLYDEMIYDRSGMLQSVEQLRDILRKSILAFFGICEARGHPSESNLMAWIDGTPEEVLAAQVERATAKLKPYILSSAL